MEMVEPAFFAPTSTPSIGPSAWDVTLPVSAAEDEVCAVKKPAKARVDMMATTVVTARNVVFVMTNPLSNGFRPKISVVLACRVGLVLATFFSIPLLAEPGAKREPDRAKPRKKAGDTFRPN